MSEKMNNLELAAKIAGLDHEKLDLPLLVGTLANIKEWSDKEKHLSALGRHSICEEWRKKGLMLLNEN